MCVWCCRRSADITISGKSFVDHASSAKGEGYSIFRKTVPLPAAYPGGADDAEYLGALSKHAQLAHKVGTSPKDLDLTGRRHADAGRWRRALR